MMQYLSWVYAAAEPLKCAFQRPNTHVYTSYTIIMAKQPALSFNNCCTNKLPSIKNIHIETLAKVSIYT